MNSIPRRLTLPLLAATASLVVTVALPGVAQAAVILTSSVPVTSSVAPRQFSARTTTSFWSVVALRPAAGNDYDLSVNGGPSSIRGGSNVDFVAIDTNICPAKTYFAVVNRYAGVGNYTVEYSNESTVLQREPLPFPDHDLHIATLFGPGIKTVDHFVGAVDIWLAAGRSVELYAAHVGGSAGDVYVMTSDPANPATCLRTPGQALAHGTINKGGHRALTMTFTPPRSGWYGIIQTTDSLNPQSGYSSVRIGQA